MSRNHELDEDTEKKWRRAVELFDEVADALRRDQQGFEMQMHYDKEAEADSDGD